MATTGHCKAYFTSASLRETGWFAVTASINRSTGGVRWQATKTDLQRLEDRRAGRGC